MEDDAIMQALRDAKPSGLANLNKVSVAPASSLLEGNFGASGADWRQGSFGTVARRLRHDDYGNAGTTDVTQAGRAVPSIAFIISRASDLSGNKRVKVTDGKIKGEYPTGMGFDNYILTLGNPADSVIYAGATFNPTTMAITSRFLGVSTAGGFPESRVESPTSGFLYWQLGFTYLTVSNVMKILNTKVGNIDFELVYGAVNGSAALLPVDSGPGWLDLDLM